MERYNIKNVEKKWQDFWSEKKTNVVNIDKKKKKMENTKNTANNAITVFLMCSPFRSLIKGKTRNNLQTV